MDLRLELIKILHSVGPENIWRPVYDMHHVKLANGIGDTRDGRPKEIAKVDFCQKTVLDLGCNFGFYAFLAKRLGAQRVVGMDINDQVIQGAEILKEMNGLKEVYFRVGDFLTSDALGTFDIGMLINFIGKGLVRTGIQQILKVVERHSLSIMIISARPYYIVTKHLGGDAEQIKSRYAPSYVRDGKFYLMDFIQDFFNDEWNMSLLSPRNDGPNIKRTLLFSRK